MCEVRVKVNFSPHADIQCLTWLIKLTILFPWSGPDSFVNSQLAVKEGFISGLLIYTFILTPNITVS